MTGLVFTELFPTESSYRYDFKLQRKKKGVFCKKCNGSAHYWLKRKSKWQCKYCKFRTGLKSGSIKKNSNLPVLGIVIYDFHKKRNFSKGTTAS